MTRNGRCLAVGIASFFAIMLTSSGCGSSMSPTTSSEPLVTQPQNAEDSQRLADHLEEEINGSAAQRGAGRYLGWRAANSPITDCMARAGFDLRATFFNLDDGYEAQATTGTTWLGEPNRRLVSRRSQGRVLAARAIDAKMVEPVPTSGPRATDAYKSALKGCDSEVGSPEGLVTAEGSELLSGQLNAVIFAVDSSLGDPAVYASCMAKSSFDLTDEDVGYSAMIRYLQTRVPASADIAAPGETPSAAWTSFLDLESRVLQADADCRQGYYATGMAALLPKLVDFQQTRSADIAAVVDRWNVMVDQATAMGWKP